MDKLLPRDGYIPAGNANLYFREIGQGPPIMVLHGGPDFDHTYLLPEMDHFSDSFRLIYYDQRGRGKSASKVQPEDVTMLSDVEDLDRLREYFHLESMTILGHSWGGLLAMEYAIHHPEHVSHLILMSTAPASRDDYLLLRKDRLERAAADIEKLEARSTDARYQEGDPDTVASYYRIHFRATLRHPEHLEKVIKSLRSSFIKEGVLKAREIEERLMHETWLSDEYDLIPKLKKLDIPTLIIHGGYDIVPIACAAHIADSMPRAKFALLRDCGHFSYLECPDEVRKVISDFFHST